MITACLILSAFAISISTVSILFSTGVISVNKPAPEKEDKYENYRDPATKLLKRPDPKSVIED